MSKLLTPVHYENAIAGLNEVRPLGLSKEVEISLDYPVLNLNPADLLRPAIGKLLRSSQAGCALADSLANSKNVEGIAVTLRTGDVHEHITFSQQVHFVITYTTSWIGFSTIYWTDPGYTREYKAIDKFSVTNLSFVGKDMYFKCGDVPTMFHTFSVYGFY